MELLIDPHLHKRVIQGTGIFVRAQSHTGYWHSVDISELAPESLLEWLRSRGGDNQWAEDVVGIILGHGHLHPKK